MSPPCPGSARYRPPLWLAALVLTLALPLSWACRQGIGGDDHDGSIDTSSDRDTSADATTTDTSLQADVTDVTDATDTDDADGPPDPDITSPDDVTEMPMHACDSREQCTDRYGEGFVCAEDYGVRRCLPAYQSGGFCAAAAYQDDGKVTAWHVTAPGTVVAGRVESLDGRLVHIAGPVIPVQVFGGSTR